MRAQGRGSRHRRGLGWGHQGCSEGPVPQGVELGHGVEHDGVAGVPAGRSHGLWSQGTQARTLDTSAPLSFILPCKNRNPQLHLAVGKLRQGSEVMSLSPKSGPLLSTMTSDVTPSFQGSDRLRGGTRAGTGFLEGAVVLPTRSQGISLTRKVAGPPGSVGCWEGIWVLPLVGRCVCV